MGKTTLYHPVSLHVIRGSLDYGGFAVGRIRQIWSSRETGQAGYVCELIKAPKGFMMGAPRNQLGHLNSLFSKDIRVTRITTAYGGKPRRRATNIRIETALHPLDDPASPGEVQPLLQPDDPQTERANLLDMYAYGDPAVAGSSLSWLGDEPVGEFSDIPF